VRGVRLHGALLILALALAFPTWTRRPSRPTDIQGTVIWQRDTTELVSISYRSTEREIEITRRARDGETFLWGWEVKFTPGEPPFDTLRFPVGVLGSELVKGFADFRVLRDLGRVEPEREAAFGLVEPRAAITLGFVDGDRVIEVGDSIYGSPDHYASDPSAGSVFVLPAQLLWPLQTGSGALRERVVHYFQDSDVAYVRVRALGQVRDMERSGGDAGAPGVWHPPDAPQRSDQTFANFMERVAQLAISGFETEVPPDSLELILRVEYADEDTEPLGFVELFRHLGSGEYYLSSERTRMVANAVGLLAERVEQDLPQIF
jgi:hypothetical protein